MANNNLDVGITIRANGGRQASAEINQVRDSVSGAGNASQNAGRQFAAMATGMSNAERDAARLATSVARATAIYNDHVARLTLSSNAYRAQQLSLQGLNAAQIRHIQTLEASSAAATRAASAYNTLGTVIGSTVGLAIVLLAHDMLKTVEQVQNMEVRLKGLTKSAQDYAQVQAYLVDVSARHHKNQLVLADSFSRLLTLEQSGIVTRKQSIALLEGMSNAASKTGATTEQLKQSMFGFSQAMGAGIVHMEELNQVTEPLPGLLNKMAESAGYSVGEFRNLVAEGKITSDVFGKIMVSSFEQYQGAAEAAGETLTAQYADISNAWTELAAVIEQPVADVITPVLEGIAWVIKGLIQDFRELKQVKDAIFGKSVTGGAPDNGMQIDLTGRAKPPGEVDATKASQAAIRKEIEATAAANTKGAKAHKAAAKVHKEAMSDEEKAAKSLQSAYDSQVKSLLQSLAASKDSSATAAMEYDVTEGALKGLVETKKLYLLQLTAEIENNKLAAQETETKKSEMDALIDKYNQLTLSARDYYQTRLDGEGIKGADQTSLLQQFDKNTKTESQLELFNKSSEALQKYAADIDNAENSMAALGATSNDVFAAANGGIGQVIGAFNAMIASLNQNSEALEDLGKKQKAVMTIQPSMDKDKYLKDLATKHKLIETYAKQEQALNADTTDKYLVGINNIAGAVGAMYQDNQAAQIAMQTVQGASLLVQAGIAIASAAAGGDGYTALARAAAMAAYMATVISQYGGGVGGAVSAPPAPPNSADTGTVLGDKTAQSESINNVYDLLKSIHAEEYAELRGINKGVAALSGGILGAVTKTFQTGAITGTSAPHLGESKYTLVSGGLATASVVLADILGGIADFAGQMYTTEQHLGGSKKKPTFSFQDYFTAMDAGVTESLKGMFAGIGDTMKSVSDQLGKDIGQDLNTKLNAAIIPALKIDILGLSGEDAVKKVNAVISTAMDTVATQVFGGIISEYQKLGEGMLETAVRIVSEMAVVKDALAQSGLSMSGNAIDLADSLVQAAGGLEQFQQQFEGFYDAFFTDIDKQNRLQTRLNETFAEVYMLLPRTREEYAKVLGALNLTNEADRERYSLMLQLSSAADSYYKMIEEKSKSAADLNAARVSQEIELMRLQGNAAGALALERRRELEAMDETLRAMQRLIYTYSDLSGALTTAYNNAADLLTQTFTKFFNLAKSLVQYRDALKVGDLSTGSPESKYKTNKAEFERVKAIIAGGKGTTELSEQRFRNALESLQSVSDKFLTSSRDYNASGKAYGMDYKSVIDTLTQGSTKSLNIASTAERQLNALNDMVSGLTTLNLSVIKLDGSIGKVDGSVDDVGARVRVSNEQLRDVNGSIKTGNTWLGKVDTKTDKVSGQLTSANVWIREGNKWLRLVDGSTGRVNERLKDSNLWIKEGNHYLSLVDKKTGKVNDKLINVDGSVKKVYHSTGNIGAAVRVSNEQLRDVNGSIKTGNTWLGKVDTKTDKVSGQLTSANVWIREGNKWLRLVDGSTGRVNERLKDSNLWIKEGNHYLSLVDKKTGKVNDKLINVDGSVKKVYHSTGNIGAAVRVSNEQLRDVNGSIKTGNTWLGKVDTKTDKVSGQLTSANVWIREGNKWLRLVDGSTGRVNEKLKDSNLWIKEGNHYLSLVDKKTGLVNDKLINVDGSVKKVYQSTDKAPSATDLVRQAINGTGGLKDATKAVRDRVKELNSKSGLSGAIGGVKSAVGSVRDAVKGMTAAIIAINKLQADRDKAAAAAAKAEAQAAAQRAREQAALDKAARDKAAAALYQQKQQAYGAIVGKTDWNAMKWLAKNAGFDEATSSTYASSWAPWAKSLIGDFDPNKTLAQYSQLSTLMDSFRKFLEASALGRGFPVDAAFFSRRAGEINGSHANGLDFVPFDGYRAELHKGERVLTAAEVRNSDKASKETIKICNEILAELKAANKQRGAVAVETLKKVDKLVEKTDAQTRAVRRIST